MRLYNTLHRKVEPFKPRTANAVTIYSCGPTVYDHAHIGNLRAFITADLLRRTLQSNNLSAHHTMNFTDVDDKMIARSQQAFPDMSPEEALLQLGRKFETVFRSGMEAIGNNLEALDFIRATESIDAMQDLIRTLYEQGFAYIADDGVYFSIEAYRSAGKTYGQLTDISVQSTHEARINNDEYDKDAAHDFALWKTRKEGEPAWEFELDDHDLLGRPGWHIECSVMSTSRLGQPFDIHTGGIDLIFPHHENEIAQSTANTQNSEYARYFVHNEHLLVDGRKMSKSLNNFYTLQDVLERSFDPLAFRLLILQAHYRTQLNFSWENLTAAQHRLNRWQNSAVMRYQTSSAAKSMQNSISDALAAAQAALNDDLDTPKALSVLEPVFEKVQDGLAPVDTAAFEEFLQFIDESLGFSLTAIPNITNVAADFLQERADARAAQDYQRADKIRDQLQEHGYIVRDTATGQFWGFLGESNEK